MKIQFVRDSLETSNMKKVHVNTEIEEKPKWEIKNKQEPKKNKKQTTKQNKNFGWKIEIFRLPRDCEKRHLRAKTCTTCVIIQIHP
jgi:hypothetical protein